MKTLYNYCPFDSPKKGIFNITTDVYELPCGWKLKQEEYTIIGETEDTYVYRLQKSGHGEWVDGKVIQYKYILPIGIHKSRLIKWKEGQLTLF